jgi:deazaflavin-dependent oxidoreductase (nitroreductase family)
VAVLPNVVAIGQCARLRSVPLPRSLAEVNRRFTNRVTRHIAGWAPGFAIVCHVGRRSGRCYRTPVNVFRRGGGYRFALTYGEGEWVRNVLAAGSCEIRTRRRTIRLTDPRLFRDPRRAGIPIPTRWVLAAVDVDEFLEMRPVGEASAS